MNAYAYGVVVVPPTILAVGVLALFPLPLLAWPAPFPSLLSSVAPVLGVSTARPVSDEAAVEAALTSFWASPNGTPREAWPGASAAQLSVQR